LVSSKIDLVSSKIDLAASEIAIEPRWISHPVVGLRLTISRFCQSHFRLQESVS